MMKAIKRSHFQAYPSKRLRSLLKVKLWRMGRALSHQNSRQRKILLERWHKNNWDITFKPAEIRSSLIAEKAQLSSELQTVKEQNKTLNEIAVKLQSTKQVVEEELERVKAEKVSLQQEVVQQRDKNEKLKEALEISKDQLFDKTPSRKRKSWNEYSEWHKKRKIQALQEKAINLLSNEQFELCSLEVRNMDSECSSKFQICPSTCSTNKENAVSQAVNEVLYTKERFGISDQAYRELSMVNESLPRSWKVKKQRNEMNMQWQVLPTTGENTVGVQQSFKRKLKDRIKNLEQKTSSDALFRKVSTVRVKLTADGTYIGPRQYIVTFGFTILDEGSAAKSFCWKSHCLHC